MAIKFSWRRIMVLSILGLVVGCSSSHESAPKDAVVSESSVVLDENNNQFELPLEKYAMSWEEFLRVEFANHLTIARCMAAHGFDYDATKLIPGENERLPNRRYGLWSKNDARINGYEIPESEFQTARIKYEDRHSEAWFSAISECRSTEEILPAMFLNSSPEPSLVDRGSQESFTAVLASSTFDSERSRWSECMQSHGIQARKGPGVLLPEVPTARADQLKVAGIDVNCKKSLGTVQTLADWEARQQEVFIQEHESQLADYRESVEDVLQRATEIISAREQ